MSAHAASFLEPRRGGGSPPCRWSPAPIRTTPPPWAWASPPRRNAAPPRGGWLCQPSRKTCSQDNPRPHWGRGRSTQSSGIKPLWALPYSKGASGPLPGRSVGRPMLPTGEPGSKRHGGVKLTRVALQIDGDVDVVGDPHEGDAAVHAVILAVEAHRPLDRAARRAPAGRRENEDLGLGDAAERRSAPVTGEAAGDRSKCALFDLKQ